MSWRIIYTHGYLKRAAKFLKRHPEILPQYEKTLRLLELNPSHPSLRLHRLDGPLRELHSVSINLSYRITLEFLLEDGKIVPVNVGSHDEVF
ncbi:plasmid stabilization protein [Desulfuromonas soudanensis]|uniref:Plasmid stabilization protein n=1 Tax=Desulfuromonas soudanensis TaxID=1603606 RepID=A0A0M4D3G3_9BACT|nr:plasmid stabilization protein [Desulfuromonas soudanensis]ALC17014.1 plasmid stabilization protein [Desulfuromonas soudanensis]